ncbi:MAG TPA: hypothetical protein VGZ47_20680 [Gemmataceae bacterium]|jgi:hypothetical protein|nr:hypothetical protein [Gemmataceae bacterium]
MRIRLLTTCVLSVLAITGCQLGRKAPYADDPALLYYKPALNDSAAVLAERNARREPVKPAMPSAAAQYARSLPPMDPTPAPTKDALVLPAAASKIKPLSPGEIQPLPPDAVVQVSATSSPSPLEIKPLSNAVLKSIEKPPVAEPLPLPSAPSVISKSILQKPPVSEPIPAPSVNFKAADGRPAIVSSIPLSPEIGRPQMPPPPMSLVHAGPVVHRDLAECYAHDSDYHLLKGILEKHYRGYYCLRYCDASVEDNYGGKVRLVDDPRLLQFHDGDVLSILGELLPESESGPHVHWDNPLYRIKNAWLVQQASQEK